MSKKKRQPFEKLSPAEQDKRREECRKLFREERAKLEKQPVKK